MANSSSGESLIERFDRVLSAFGPDSPELGFREICRSTGLPPSTAHRILGDMKRAGWLETGAAGSYRVGTRLWELASRSSSADSLAAAAIPFMSDVHTVLRQHVHVGVVEGHDVLFAERIAASGSTVPLRSNVAGRLPLRRSATGLALLSQCPPGTVAQYHRAAATPDAAGGPAALTVTAERFAADLAVFAQRGYAIQRERIDHGTGGVAVPLRVPAGHRAVALGTVLPLEEMRDADVPAIMQTLRVAGHGISRALGAL